MRYCARVEHAWSYLLLFGGNLYLFVLNLQAKHPFKFNVDIENDTHICYLSLTTKMTQWTRIPYMSYIPLRKVVPVAGGNLNMCFEDFTGVRDFESDNNG